METGKQWKTLCFSSGTLIQQNIRDLKKKKKGANEREITFEKFRELQSETVAKATLYQ